MLPWTASAVYFPVTVTVTANVTMIVNVTKVIRWFI
jgi:hypothetical protein